jgi:glutamyl/glutaminyl-tRNA synthetase
MTDGTGRRLAKRDGATSLRSLRQSGIAAQAILQRLEKEVLF